MAGYYIVAIVVAFGVAYAFYFFLLRHWIHAVRERKVSSGNRELREAERAYEKQIAACQEKVARLSRVAEPSDPRLIEAQTELEGLVRSRGDLDRAFAKWNSGEQES